MANGLEVVRKPPNYRPPDWKSISQRLDRLRKQRDKKIQEISRIKRARRDQWDHLLGQIPAAWRKMAPLTGFPDVAEMTQRVAGMISSQEPVVEVLPPSAISRDIKAAAEEEGRLHSLRITIDDQQDRDIYAMGIDGQVAWGESWITVLPDPSRSYYGEEEADEEKDAAIASVEEMLGFRRGKKETARHYLDRAKQRMAFEGVPIVIEDHDPQTVYPQRAAGGQLKAVLIESEHTVMDIETGLGFRARKKPGQKRREWYRDPLALGSAEVPEDVAGASTVIDVDHDNPSVDGQSGGGSEGPRAKRTIYLDPWIVQVWIEDTKVEEWKHDWGLVPAFPALGEQTSDQAPGEEGRSVIEGAVTLASEIVVAAATITANSKLHGFPTPFLKNPEHGMTWDRNFNPPVRKVHHGELNMLGTNEEIDFPFLNAHMGPDFYKHVEMLINRLQSITISGWGSEVSPETSGYAIAQLRAMQNSILGPIYKNAARQWRKIFAFLRFLVQKFFPAGLWLRGAVQTVEVEGKEHQYVPIVRYAAEDTTNFQINVRIEEGILQDEMAERKSALEMHEGGAWAMRRVREKTGVEDPQREAEEIKQDRLLNSPAMDQQILTLAMAMATDRYALTQSQNSSVFSQALQQAKAQVLGTEGDFQNQPGEPMNAGPGGQPVQQAPAPQRRQPGGPTQGPPPLEQMGVPGIPGGVRGGQPPGR